MSMMLGRHDSCLLGLINSFLHWSKTRVESSLSEGPLSWTKGKLSLPSVRLGGQTCSNGLLQEGSATHTATQGETPRNTYCNAQRNIDYNTCCNTQSADCRQSTLIHSEHYQQIVVRVLCFNFFTKNPRKNHRHDKLWTQS